MGSQSKTTSCTVLLSRIPPEESGAQIRPVPHELDVTGGSWVTSYDSQSDHELWKLLSKRARTRTKKSSTPSRSPTPCGSGHTYVVVRTFSLRMPPTPSPSASISMS